MPENQKIIIDNYAHFKYIIDNEIQNKQCVSNYIINLSYQEFINALRKIGNIQFSHCEFNLTNSSHSDTSIIKTLKCEHQN